MTDKQDKSQEIAERVFKSLVKDVGSAEFEWSEIAQTVETTATRCIVTLVKLLGKTKMEQIDCAGEIIEFLTANVHKRVVGILNGASYG